MVFSSIFSLWQSKKTTNKSSYNITDDDDDCLENIIDEFRDAVQFETVESNNDDKNLTSSNIPLIGTYSVINNGLSGNIESCTNGTNLSFQAHYRCYCTTHKYVEPTVTAAQTNHNNLLQNRNYCHQCFCIVCCKLVVECKNWESHCNNQHHYQNNNIEKGNKKRKQDDIEDFCSVDKEKISKITEDQSSYNNVHNKMKEGEYKQSSQLFNSTEPVSHFRQYCPFIPFEVTHQIVNKNHCKECFYFICKVPADQCNSWDNNHCHATNDTCQWTTSPVQQYKIHKEESIKFEFGKASNNEQQSLKNSNSAFYQGKRKQQGPRKSNDGIIQFGNQVRKKHDTFKVESELDSDKSIQNRRKYIVKRTQPMTQVLSDKTHTHYRFCCPNNSNFCHDKAMPVNQVYCNSCYCYVCNELVSKCYAWNTSHCHATNKGQWAKTWLERRNLHLVEAAIGEEL